MSGDLTDGGYLRLDRLLTAQEPRSRPEQHDELLFLVLTFFPELYAVRTTL